MVQGKKRRLAPEATCIAASRSIPTDLPSAIFSIECSTVNRNSARCVAEQHYASRLPSVMQEREFRVPAYDKMFACEWQDSENIVIGTKCNALLRLHVPSGEVAVIPRPAAPQRGFDPENPGWGCCGIHCLASNPARDLLATGGAEPADCVILRTTDWAPVVTLIGHRDWLFGLAWVTDRHVVTGSRDCSIALWNVDAEADAAAGENPPSAAVQEYNFYNPSQMKRKYDGKVRDVQYDSDLGLLAALSTEGVVKLHDPARDLRVVRTLNVGCAQELVSMAVSHDVVAVGALSKTILVDPRKRGTSGAIASLQSPDLQHGIRSVCINDRVLSFGTGKGKLCFYDLRAGRYLPTMLSADGGKKEEEEAAGMSRLAPELQPLHTQPYFRMEALLPSWHFADPAFHPVSAPKPGHHLPLGEGWVEPGSTFFTFFPTTDATDHACYAHAWDPSGTRLFACGGPLAFGLKGGYMGIWE